nr:unnamed protein product [Callosobruchus chinensis]
MAVIKLIRWSERYGMNPCKGDYTDEIDAVYIPPEVDTLTDEEDVNDDMNPRESEEPIDIVRTLELLVPDNTELPDQSFTLSTENSPS